MTYTLDVERNKYIAYIDITRYNEAMKQDLKKVALYSSKLKAWISRAKKDSINIMKFINIMKKYNITLNKKTEIKEVKKVEVKTDYQAKIDSIIKQASDLLNDMDKSDYEKLDYTSCKFLESVKEVVIKQKQNARINIAYEIKKYIYNNYKKSNALTARYIDNRFFVGFDYGDRYDYKNKIIVEYRYENNKLIEVEKTSNKAYKRIENTIKNMVLQGFNI